MASKLSAAALKADGEKIIQTFEENPDFEFKSVTKEQFQDKIDALVAAESLVGRKKNELKAVVDDRDDLARELRSLISRARSIVRGQYGPNSKQYEVAGCVRSSERKTPQRTTKTEK